MNHVKKSMFIILAFLLIFPLANCKNDNTDDAITRSFWINDANGNSNTWEKITAERMHQSDRTNVWVKQDEKKYISQELIDTYGNYFTDSAYNNVSSYVYTITNFFGEAGNRINILFYIGDDTTAGYFWGKDFYSNADLEDYGLDDELKSNETNIFYMNINSAVSNNNQSAYTLFTKGTLTHEFQHMAQAHFFMDAGGNTYLDTWADELCSVTIESIFAQQMQIYLAAYNSDSEADKLFASGVRLVGWDNYFEQYTAAAMFGTYIMSQLAEAKRPNFIKTFLDVSLFSVDITSQYYIINTLENSQVAYWTSTTSLTDDNAIRTKWAALLEDFIRKGVLGKNASNAADTSYVTYLNSISGSTTMSVTPQVVTASGSINLEPSAWVIAKVNVGSLSSTLRPGLNTGSTPAYAVAYHDGLYQFDDYYDIKLPTSITTDTFTVVAKSTPLAKKSTFAGFPFNRSMNPLYFLDSLLPGGKRSVSNQTITDGSLHYFYVPL